MIKLIKRAIWFFMKPLFVINNWFRQLRYFVIPNSIKIFRNKIQFRGNWPKCDQLTCIRGNGIVIIGDNCNFGYKPGGFHRGGMIEFQPRYKDAEIVIGNNVATNNNIFLCAANHIEIGDNTLIGQNVNITDFEAHGIDPLKRQQLGEIGKVVIGKNVWIGSNVSILKNSVIGDNTIIATGAVVSGKFQENLIIGGIPAKIIKEINV
jgi:acetyltransferase-like isoleucine patch superfamily enzyme